MYKTVKSEVEGGLAYLLRMREQDPYKELVSHTCVTCAARCSCALGVVCKRVAWHHLLLCVFGVNCEVT